MLGVTRFVPLAMKRRSVYTQIAFVAGNEPPPRFDPASLKALAPGVFSDTLQWSVRRRFETAEHVFLNSARNRSPEQITAQMRRCVDFIKSFHRDLSRMRSSDSRPAISAETFSRSLSDTFRMTARLFRAVDRHIPLWRRTVPVANEDYLAISTPPAKEKKGFQPKLNFLA